MKVLKKTWFCAGLLLCIGLVLLAAQETVSADDVDALTLQMDGFLKERNELDEKEASVLSTIENSVSIYQSSELAKRYAELERYKDYFEAQEYQDARTEEEKQVSEAVQQERIRLEQNAKPELDEISRKKAELTEKIKELEKVLLNKTYKIHTVHVVEKKYDKSTKTINIRFVVPEFEENYDVIYAFDIVGMTPYEIAKKAAEEEEKDYSADVYYTVTKEDDTDFYVVTVTSLDVYSENGEKVVSDFKQYKDTKKFAEGEFFFNAVNMKMSFVFVQGGTFSMGSNNGYGDEKPVHNVTVSDFYICDHEVTQAEYKAIMGTNPSYFKGDNLPVECVSWNDAVEYCNKLSVLNGFTPCYKFNDGNVTCDWNANGYRLPTEAEWEYAAKGGKNGSGYTYSGSNSIGLVAWYGYEDDYKMKGNSNEQTHAVKEKQPNELGLYDMSGNVWELCRDRYGNYSSGAVTNPLGASSGSGRVMRGGGWLSFASSCRVAIRYNNTPDGASDVLGFRVVRSAN